MVSESATLHNSLFASLIPSEVLSVTGVGIASSPNAPLTGNKVTSPSTGSAYDLNGAYISYVPLDGNGNPQYGAWNKPNTNCSASTSSFGPMALVPHVSAGMATSCNYLFLGDSTGSGGSGALSSSNPNDPIAFTFVNDTGGTTSFAFTNEYAVTGNIYILNAANNASLNPSFGQNGFYNGNPKSGKAPCNGSYCGFGVCPENNLYGSLSAEAQGSGSNFVPVQDSVDIYYSGFELQGLPPTHNTNHQLTPFIGAPVAFDSSWKALAADSQSAISYVVEAVCPQFPVTSSQAQSESALAAASPGGSNAGAGFVPADTNIGVANAAFSLYLMNPGYGTPSTISVTVPASSTGLFATYYPDTAIPASGDASFGTGFAPEISACTPAAYPAPAGTSVSGPWWGWAGSNSGTSAGSGNCANAPPATRGSSNLPYQTGTYNNCALLIQPLGTNAPTTDADVTTSTGGPVLPDYYGEIVTSPANGTVLALDPIYDMPKSYVDAMTGLTVPAEAAYYTPTTASFTSITGGSFSGDFLKLEQPAQNSSGKYTYSLPPETSHQCYNPGSNGKLLYGPVVHTPYDNTPYSDPTYGDPPDQIQDAHEGVVYCGLNPGASFALYWNDMGGGQSDDLGYWNEITEFTCPSAPNNNAGAGPASLSG